MLNGMYFWTWNTREVLDMLEWMREYNASGEGEMRFTPVAPRIVVESLARSDLSYAATVSDLYGRINDSLNNIQHERIDDERAEHFVGLLREAREVVRSLEAGHDGYGGDRASEHEWALQNARVIRTTASKCFRHD